MSAVARATGLMVLIGLLLVACGEPVERAQPAGKPPNILFILLDDLGVNDVGAYGGGAGLTPNIDRIAAAGARFNRHYTDSTCTATRIGILTGLEPAALGFRPNGAGIPAEVDTLPERLQQLGYTTHHIGKWHAGSVAPPAWPLAQGYDTFFGFLDQFLLRGPHPAGELHEARPTYRNPWLQEDDGHPSQYAGHLSDILNQRVMDFLGSREAGDSPWFLTYWTYAPHTPLEPADRFAARHPDTPQGRYLALVEHADTLVGRVVDRLDEQGLADNTLVIVASDNGGTAREYPSNLPFTGSKAQFTEGGVRTPMLMRWRGHIPAGTVVEGVVSNKDYADTLVQLAGGKFAAGQAVDIVAAAHGKPVPDRPLFWESANYFLNSWSMLAEGGNWRLTKIFNGDYLLFDLSNPYTERLVDSREHSALVGKMRSAYQQWRIELRQVEVQLASSGGTKMLVGNDFQRSPGSEGWSFAVAVTPQQMAGEEDVVAEQEGFWSLRRSGGMLRLSLLDMTVQAAAPPLGVCTEITVSNYMTRSSSAPSFRRGLLELFYNGESVAATSTKDPKMPVDGHSRPTYLGQNAKGGQAFTGELGVPVILNERLVNRESANPDLQNGVESVAGRLCP
ncbi:sulfatase-like hydrolase/transferase [Parahaliea mediterranea]|uniref:sulfatase-like hydrolase/transferase n=1 Tax=Parahaliea mediterranea TaxID=651086 RepID=UPI000E2FD28B|nr:sulfatase-like hydrolase/transferase [Parahaliea mediterranea]